MPPFVAAEWSSVERAFCDPPVFLKLSAASPRQSRGPVRRHSGDDKARDGKAGFDDTEAAQDVAYAARDHSGPHSVSAVKSSIQ